MSNTISEDKLEKLIFKYLDILFKDIKLDNYPRSDDPDGISYWIDSSKRYFLYDPSSKIVFIDGSLIVDVDSFFNLNKTKKAIKFIKKWLEPKINLPNFIVM